MSPELVVTPDCPVGFRPVALMYSKVGLEPAKCGAVVERLLKVRARGFLRGPWFGSSPVRLLFLYERSFLRC
jgi:hypothetical protein